MADTATGLWLGKAKVLRGLRNFLNTDRPEHHSTDCLKRKEEMSDVSTLRDQEWSVFNQTCIGTVWRISLGELGDRAFLRARVPSWAEAGNSWLSDFQSRILSRNWKLLTVRFLIKKMLDNVFLWFILICWYQRATGVQCGGWKGRGEGRGGVVGLWDFNVRLTRLSLSFRPRHNFSIHV